MSGSTAARRVEDAGLWVTSYRGEAAVDLRRELAAHNPGAYLPDLAMAVTTSNIVSASPITPTGGRRAFPGGSESEAEWRERLHAADGAAGG